MKTMILKAIAEECDLKPLKAEDPRWVDFDSARGIESRTRIVTQLHSAETAGKYMQIMLSGHRGSGKTTELNRVIADAQSHGYLTLYASVTEAIDPNEISFGDVFLLMTRLLEHTFRENAGLEPLPEKAVNSVTAWFREITRVDEHEVERSIQYGGEAALGINTPLAKLLFALNALRKSTSKRREEIREAIERYPRDLLRNLNLLLEDARRISRATYPKGILFVLDDIERYTPEIVNNALLRSAGLFNDITAHTIFTMPAALMDSPLGEAVHDLFAFQTLPMVAVIRRHSRLPNEQGVDRLIEAIYRRVDRSLFTEDGVARQIAHLSGGCPHDLLLLLKEALLESDEQLDARSVERAASVLRSQMSRPITREQFQILARVHLEGRIDPDETGIKFLSRRYVLEYNGERWVDVHPLLQGAFEFQAALEGMK